MGIFRETMKNADMKTKKNLAVQATLLGLDLDKAMEFLDAAADLHIDLLKRNLETAGLQLVNGEYQEIRYQEDIEVIDNDMKIYKEDPEE